MEQHWLTNHLGHTMDIHKIHYRQTAGVIERVDLAKLMLMQELNITGKYAGKKLSDIQLPGLYIGTKILMKINFSEDRFTVNESLKKKEVSWSASSLARTNMLGIASTFLNRV